MGRTRSKRARTSFCPACDHVLSAELETSPQPRCPACDTALQPTEAAAAWGRAAAAAVDLAVLLPTAGGLNWALLRVLDRPSLWENARGLDALLQLLAADPGAIVGRIAPFIGMAAVYFVLFWGLTGKTPGQSLLRITVVGRDGGRPGWVWAAVRVLGAGIGFVLGAIGWLWAAFDLERRAWHDIVARTYVVRQR